MKVNWKQFLNQFIRVSPRRLILMLAGNLILALGVALFGAAGLGNHPFHTMLYAAGGIIPGDYQTWYQILQPLLNLTLAVIIVFFLSGQKHIGWGSIVNTVFLSSVIKGLTWLLEQCGLSVESWGKEYVVPWLGLNNYWQLPLELLATVVISLGISLYQAGELGAAPYDAMPLVAVDRGRHFAPWRMLCDGLCLVATAAFLVIGGLQNLPTGETVSFGRIVSFLVASEHAPLARIGLGTVITVFCTGPFIRFFDRTVSGKLAGKKPE